VKHIARETLRVYADQRRRAIGQIPHREDHCFFTESIVAALESMDPEDAEF
jgi:hypothetical protein